METSLCRKAAGVYRSYQYAFHQSFTRLFFSCVKNAPIFHELLRIYFQSSLDIASDLHVIFPFGVFFVLYPPLHKSTPSDNTAPIGHPSVSKPFSHMNSPFLSLPSRFPFTRLTFFFLPLSQIFHSLLHLAFHGMISQAFSSPPYCYLLDFLFCLILPPLIHYHPIWLN